MLRILLVVVQFVTFARGQNRNEEDLVNELGARIGDILDPTRTPDPSDELELGDADDTITIPEAAHTVFKDPIGDWYYLYLHNTTITGSADLVDSVDKERNELEIYLTAKIKRLIIRGNCTLRKTTSTLLESITQIESGGAFDIEIANVTVEGIVFLVARPNGHLVVNKVVPNVTYHDSDISMKYEISPATVSFAAETVLLILKPYLTENIHVRLTNVATLQALMESAAIPMKRGVLPIDSAIFKARKLVNQRYEPHEIPFFSLVDSSANTTLGPIQLRGLSNFQRAGNVTVNAVDCVAVRIGIKIVTAGRIRGRCPLIFSYENRSDAKDLARFTLQPFAFTAALDLAVGDSHAHPILRELDAHAPHINDGFQIRLDSGSDVAEFRFILFSGIKNWLKKRIEEYVRTEILSKLDNKQFQRRIVDVCSAAHPTRCGTTHHHR